MSRVFVIVEDGTEYRERFTRFLGGEFTFRTAQSAAECIAQLDGAAGLVLDLDFRRTPASALIDEDGATADGLSTVEQKRRAEMQGILILRHLRARGVTLPALLCADLDDPAQRAYLEETLAPLTIVGSRATLAELAALLRT